MNVEDKTSIPGYIYFRDNGMDYKIGLTNNLVVRGRAYKTENPRDTVIDSFSVETYAEAEAIETEMKAAARSEGLCSFDNSDEWLVRTVESEAFWNLFVQEYAKKTCEEWITFGSRLNGEPYQKKKAKKIKEANKRAQILNEKRTEVIKHFTTYHSDEPKNLVVPARLDKWVKELSYQGIEPTYDERQRFNSFNKPY